MTLTVSGEMLRHLLQTLPGALKSERWILAQETDTCRADCLRTSLVSAAYPGVDRKPDRSELSRHHCVGPGVGAVRNLLRLCPVFVCPWKMLALKEKSWALILS